MIDYNSLFHIDHIHSLSLLNPANLFLAKRLYKYTSRSYIPI